MLEKVPGDSVGPAQACTVIGEFFRRVFRWRTDDDEKEVQVRGSFWSLEERRLATELPMCHTPLSVFERFIHSFALLLIEVKLILVKI